MIKLNIDALIGKSKMTVVFIREETLGESFRKHTFECRPGAVSVKIKSSRNRLKAVI